MRTTNITQPHFPENPDKAAFAPVATAAPFTAFPKDRSAQDDYVIQILIGSGLTTLDDIFNDGIHLQTAETRNHNVSVRIRSHLAVHVKLPVDHASNIALREESKVLHHLAEYLSAAAQPHVPQLCAYDGATGALITRFLEGTSLGRNSGLLATLAAASVQGLGGLLREAHASPFATQRGSRELPFATGLLRPSLSYVHHSSSASMRLLRLVQNSIALRRSLERVAAEWRCDAFIHGDMKLENLLLLANSGNLALLDWEYGRRGDARWDLGSLIAELIYVWVVQTVDRDLGAGNADIDLPHLQNLIKAFITAYAGEYSTELLLSCADFVVARLLQSAFELHKYRTDIDLIGVRVLQAAENIAADRAMFRQLIAIPS